MEQLAELWDRVLETVRPRYTEATMITFIRPIRAHKYDMELHTLYLVAPSDTVRDTFMNRHAPIVTPLAQAVFADEYLRISIYSEDDIAHQDDGFNDKRRARYKATNLIDYYIFDNFVKGKSNELAFSACMYVAESIAGGGDNLIRNHYNPLFLYGGVGLGKTHLMHSIGNLIMDSGQDKKILYVPAEQLTNEFILAIREGRNPEFRDKYRTIDVLLIDDIQFLEEKDGTQEEFFHTFNTLYNANKQIVISSDRPPGELVKFHNRLVSRFDNGTMVDISQPDFETRCAILEKKASLHKITLAPDIIHFVAKNISSNIRALEGALNTLASYVKLANPNITLESAEEILKGKIGPAERVITIELIQEITAKRLGTTKEELKSKKRTQAVTYARHVSMYLCRMLMNSTHDEIGAQYGKRDHTTAIYACNKIGSEIETNSELKLMIAELEKEIKGD